MTIKKIILILLFLPSIIFGQKNLINSYNLDICEYNYSTNDFDCNVAYVDSYLEYTKEYYILTVPYLNFEFKNYMVFIRTEFKDNLYSEFYTDEIGNKLLFIYSSKQNKKLEGVSIYFNYNEHIDLYTEYLLLFNIKEIY